MSFDSILTTPQRVIAAAKAATGNQTLRFPAEQGKYGIGFAFSKYSYSAATGDGGGALASEDQRGAIILPVPLNLDETLTVGSKETQLGASGNAAAVVASRFQGAVAEGSGQGLMNEISGMFSGVGASLANSSAADYTAYAGYAARQISGISSSVAAGIDVGTGVAVNPYESVDFDGVRLKQYDFTWSLSPSSPAESDSLRRIINTFKANALPNYAGAVGDFAKLLLEFPSLVTIKLIGLDTSYYHSIFKPALLKSVQVRYNEGPHLNVFAGGRPVTVDLTISLVETKIHTRDDYLGVNA